jgi:hypothetical protein
MRRWRRSRNKSLGTLPTDLQGAAWSKGDLERAWPEIQDFIVNLREGENELRPHHQRRRGNHPRGEQSVGRNKIA